jgi:3'-phosphoadenosine 5'-phosphosulfate sulfotransferase (PAPS reductase)/FAD synthetase/ferredoxin
MFKVIWDKDYNGVRLTLSSSGESLNVCPRPVFWEELEFLGLKREGWQFPQSQEPLLWACDRRYYYKGELVLEIKGGDLYDSHTIEFCEPNLHLEPIDLEVLRQRNEDSMFLIEHEAMTFIHDEYRRYKQATQASNNNPDLDFQQLAENIGKKTKTEHVVVKEDCDSFDIMPLTEAEMKGKGALLKSKIDYFVISFSGGKDSQVILDLVTRVIPSEDLVVIYSDTGYELPPSLDLYQEIEAFYKAKYPHLNFYTSKNHQPLMYYWDKMGAPSRVLRWCCSIMKSAPLSRMLKELHGGEKQPNAILFDGVRAEESVNRSSRSRIGKNAKHNNIINMSPILEWNATETYLYLLLHGIPINEAYRKGYSRVGCVICPYSSKWSENISSKVYPDSIKPFVDHIRHSLEESKVDGIDNYIKIGKWKERAGGRTVKCESGVNFVEEGADFKAVLTNPREDVFMWLNILGEYRGDWNGLTYIGSLKYKKNIYRFQIERQGDDVYVLTVFETQFDVIFMSHIKKVLYKATYCIHCEVCEVECPTGALSVVPYATIDASKCIHCLKCIDFDGKGCLSASSVSISTGDKVNKMTSAKSGINRYNDGMGLREAWLRKYFNSYETFFDNDEHGLNTRYQLPPFINWIREACILNEGDKKISETGLLLANNFGSQSRAVWEIIFVNLSENSEVTKWFCSQVPFNRNLTKQELEVMIQNAYPDLKDRTLKNPLNSLLNMFKESPLGNEIGIAEAVSINRKPGIMRHPNNNLSLVATAYSLFKYAEKNNRYLMTVSEFYNEEQAEGIYRQFGISREVFEQNLRTLEQDKNHVLRAELKMGLDNIVLREDLTSLDILKLLL